MTRELKQSLEVIQKRLLPLELTSDRIRYDQNNLWVAPCFFSTSCQGKSDQISAWKQRCFHAGPVMHEIINLPFLLAVKSHTQWIKSREKGQHVTQFHTVPFHAKEGNDFLIFALWKPSIFGVKFFIKSHAFQAYSFLGQQCKVMPEIVLRSNLKPRELNFHVCYFFINFGMDTDS